MFLCVILPRLDTTERQKPTILPFEVTATSFPQTKFALGSFKLRRRLPAPFGVAWKLYGNVSEVPVGCNEILDKKSVADHRRLCPNDVVA